MARNFNEISQALVDGAKAKSTKEASLNLQAKLIEQVADGYVDPLLALSQLTCMKDACENAIAVIKEQFALTEAEKYPEKTVRVYGCSFEKREVGVKYDYSADEEWQAYNREVVAFTAQRKAREIVLRKMGQCAKVSTTSLVVTMI